MKNFYPEYVMRFTSLSTSLQRVTRLRQKTRACDFTNTKLTPIILLNLISNGPNPTTFCLFLFFTNDNYSKNLTINYNSRDGELIIRTRGDRMAGKDKSTELSRHLVKMTLEMMGQWDQI